jgi:hypothetical protein
MHSQKDCPVCGKKFECRAGDIVNCQCFSIFLTAEESLAIGSFFGDCLCADCIAGMKKKFFESQKESNQKGLSNL